jgi:autotransporter-associated beta strand protein
VNAYPDNTYQAATDGLIISSQITSSATLTKTGNGVLVLGGASNSFGNGTVGLIVSQGTVSLQNSGAAGSTNQQIQLANNGQLQGAATATLTLTNPVTAGAASFSGSPLMLSGGLIQSAHGELDVTNTTTIDNYVNNLALSQFAVDGKMGPGTLILSGQASGTATGIFSQDDGVLAFDSDTPLPTGMTLRFVAGTVEAVNNPHTISNPLSIVEDATFAGTEALTFSATTGNTLSATSTRTIYVNDTAPVTINNLNAQQSTLIAGGSGTLVLAGNPTGLLATQITSGTLQIQNPNAPGASLGAVTVSNLGALNLNNYNAIISSLSGNGTVQLGSGSLTTQAGVFSGIINGTGNLIKSWTGMLTLSGANAYSGTTTISSGALQFAKELSLYNNNTSQWNAMNIVVSNGAMLALNVGGSGQFTSGDVSTLLGLGTSNGGFESGSIIGLDTTNAIGGNVTYSGVIANPNSGANALGLTKLGVGTLTLSGANSYSGPTTVSGGVLVIIQNLTSSSLVSIASGAKLNLASGNFAISGTITNNGTLVLGNGVTLSSTGTFTNNGTLDLTNDPSFNLPSNFVNNGTVLTPATDTPTMPPWGLAILGALLLITSAKSLPQRLAASSVEENENG